MIHIGQRPKSIPIIQMTAPDFPKSWRAIIEPELTEAQMSIRSLLDNRARGNAFKMRQRIWRRIHEELGISVSYMAVRFGFHHTTILYALGRLGRQKGN